VEPGPWIDAGGKDLDSAIAAALAELGIPRSEAEVLVVRRPRKRGLAGIGKKYAVIRVRHNPGASRQGQAPPVVDAAAKRGPKGSSIAVVLIIVAFIVWVLAVNAFEL
jgi:hypothetical protein